MVTGKFPPVPMDAVRTVIAALTIGGAGGDPHDVEPKGSLEELGQAALYVARAAILVGAQRARCTPEEILQEVAARMEASAHDDS